MWYLRYSIILLFFIFSYESSSEITLEECCKRYYACSIKKDPYPTDVRYSRHFNTIVSVLRAIGLYKSCTRSNNSGLEDFTIIIVSKFSNVSSPLTINEIHAETSIDKTRCYEILKFLTIFGKTIKVDKSYKLNKDFSPTEKNHYQADDKDCKTAHDLKRVKKRKRHEVDGASYLEKTNNLHEWPKRKFPLKGKELEDVL